MAQVKGKQRLCQISLSDFNVECINSSPFYRRYEEFIRVFKKCAPQVDCERFFAQPVENPEKGTIDWYIPQNESDTVKLSSLIGTPEYDTYKLQLDNTIRALKVAAVTANNETAKNYIDCAMKYVDNEYIDNITYICEGNIILGVWGMGPRLGRSISTVITDDVMDHRVHTVSYRIEGEGFIAGTAASFLRQHGHILQGNKDIPEIVPAEGYSFTAWRPVAPQGKAVNEDMEFVAVCEVSEIPPVAPIPMPITEPEEEPQPEPEAEPVQEEVAPAPVIIEKPWWKRIWVWLLGILGVLLLLLLLLFLLRSCHRHHHTEINGVVPIDTIDTKKGLVDDNGFVKPITDGTGKLPSDEAIVAPVRDEDGNEPPIQESPGVPNIIGNRLFLFMEDGNGDLDALAADFKKAYPSDEYSIIGYDRQVKYILIQVPEAQRDNIRKELNSKIPNHKFFVFDEQIYELNAEGAADSPAEKGWHIDAIHLKQGWEITKGSAEVKVAIVDDGIEPTHPLFKDRIVNAYNVFTRDNSLSIGEGHGTHTAGLAVGSAVNVANGATGVAPNCKIMPIQVFDNKKCPMSALVSGIMYAIHHGADVINVSIGPSFPGLNALPVEMQEEIAREQFINVQRLWTKVCNVAAEKKSIIVFASGNDDIISSIPPENRNNAAIVVTAVDKNRYPTDFTNYGPGSDISAPGKDIYSSFPRGTYKSEDGTSMAAPIVAGTIALMKSLKKDLTVTQARNVLYRTGADVYGYIPPMVLVYEALLGVQSGDFSAPEHRVVTPVPDGNGDGSAAGALPVIEVPSDGIQDGNMIIDPATGIIIDPGTGRVVTGPRREDVIIGGNPGGSVGNPDRGVVTDPGTGTGRVNDGDVVSDPRRGSSDDGDISSPRYSDDTDAGHSTSPNPRDETDYDAIRRKIREYERKIERLKGQLPENRR